MLDTFRSVAPARPGAVTGVLNPAFRYLRVTIDNRVALLALGNVDEDPGGPIEVWYSAAREVLRLQNGRVVGASGLTTEWRNVSLPVIPRWAELARGDAPYRWERVRDVMPGYRYGVRDSLTLRRVAPPSRSRLAGVASTDLAWFEERAEQLPLARYAVEVRDGVGTAVYGEQCLALELCFSWQRWPAPSSVPERH